LLGLVPSQPHCPLNILKHLVRFVGNTAFPDEHGYIQIMPLLVAPAVSIPSPQTTFLSSNHFDTPMGMMGCSAKADDLTRQGTVC